MKFLSDLQVQKKYLKHNQSYLRKGVYILHENLRTYILNEHMKDNWFPTAKHTVKNTVKVLIARIFYSVRIREGGNEFSAQAVYFSTVPQVYNRDVKFFDYGAKKIRTVCPNKRRYDLYMRNRTYFEQYFPMVELLSADEERFVFEEKMIDKRSVPDSEWESVFRTIFDVYSAYYKAAEIDKMSTEYHCTRISSCNPEKDVFSTTLYRQHGDLSSDNFIYDTAGRAFFIDYDHADYYPAFYDLFFLMLNLYIWKGNDIGINLMLSGAFDDYFRNASENGITSSYDAFLLFANYYLDVCNKDGIPHEWQTKYELVLHDILEKLKR